MPTLVSFREVQDGRDGGITLSSGSVGATTNNTYTRSFVAEFLSSDAPNGPDQAILTPGVPGIGDPYVSGAGVYDLTSFCVSVKAAQLKAPWVWQLTCAYTSDIDLSNPSGDPLLMPPVFSWGDKTATRPAKTYDAAGIQVACLNAAGDPFNPPPTDEESWTTLEIARNFASFDYLAKSLYKNCVNDDAWLGFQPGEVLCVGMSDETEYVKGAVIHKVKGKFEIKRKGRDSWAFVALNQGFQSYYTYPAPLGTIKEANKDAARLKTLPGAALLDANGFQLPQNGVPIFLKFYTKLKAVFANIGLP